MNIVKLPANLVKAGDVLYYSGEEYELVHVIKLNKHMQLNYKGGYFNFQHDRLVEIVDKRNEFNIPADYYVAQPIPELGHAIKPTAKAHPGFTTDPLATPTIHFNNEVYQLFTPVSDEEDVLGKDVEVGDVIWVNNNWATVTNVYKHPHSPTNKVNVDYGNVKGLQVRLALTGTFSRKVRAAMETLNIQNAIEAQRILLQKLGQMLEATQLQPGEDGKIAVANTSFRVDKATVVKVTRDEMKVAYSKASELTKKL